MKIILLGLLCLLLINSKAKAQDFYQTDITIGPAQNSGIAMGFGIRNIHNSTGMYLNYYGTGSAYAYTSNTGIDYSYISDQTNITNHGVTETNVYGASLGVSVNLAHLINQKDHGLSINFGAGYVRIQQISQTSYYYVWHDLPELNSSNLATYVSDDRYELIAEFMLNYDIYNSEYFCIAIRSGYSLHVGAVAQLSLGIKKPKDEPRSTRSYSRDDRCREWYEECY